MFASAALILALFASPFSVAAPLPRENSVLARQGGPLIPVSKTPPGGIPGRPIGNPGGPLINSTTPGETNPGGPISLITSFPTSFPAPGKGCSLKSATIDFPAGQTALAVPTETPKIVALGVGVQNYTCSSAGTWTSIGAVASLYDISCAIGTPLFNASNAAAVTALKAIATRETPILSHFFVNSTSGLEPRFEESPFQTTKIGSTFSKAAALASPAGSTNVAWLQLTQVSGNLAGSGYRVDTVLGSPPASCTPATDTSTLSVPYQAHYYFYA